MSPATKEATRGGFSRAKVTTTAAVVGDGTLAALRDTLTALRAETGPKTGHAHSREVAVCWHAVFQDLEKIEQAFVCQEELAQTLAQATRDVAAARRASVLGQKAERLRHTVLGLDSPSVVTPRDASSGAILHSTL